MRNKLKTALAVAALISAVVPAGIASARVSKIDICHVNGQGDFHLINVSTNSKDAHFGHGDGVPGEVVPSMSDYVFASDCSMKLAVVPTALTDLSPISCSVGWGYYLIDESWYGAGFNVGGTHYDSGYFAHGPSVCTWTLSGGFQTLSGLVGLEDGDGNCGNGVQFYVVADGTEIWRSSTVVSAQAAVAFSVAINSATTLTLGVDSLGSNVCDESVWIAPTLS